MDPLQHGIATLGSEAEILLGIRESARILFGTGRIAFLLVNPDTQVMSGAVVDGQPEILQRLEIPLATSQSLVAGSLLNNQPRSTFVEDTDESVSLVDAQIVRSLNSDGVLYLPLSGHEQNLGVMVLGISAAHHGKLRSQLSWMTSFTRMAATSIEAWRDMEERKRSVEVALTKRYELQARRVFHEAGNPLGIITNYLSIIRKKLPESTDLQQEMDILKEEIDRVTQIVRQMNSLPELSASGASLDLNTLIESMLVLYGRSLFINRGITVEKALDPALKQVACNRDSLKQVLVNLWNNAADAMQDGGTFTISTHADVNENGRAYVEIRLCDTGPGLPPDVMQHLFQPLDPNRRPGHAGIGLSIVASLVEQLDGRITCRSKAGHGACFTVLLPQTAGPKQ